MSERDFGFILQIIKEQFPGRSNISLHEPLFEGNELKYVADAIDSTYVSSIGSYVHQFESALSKLTMTKKAVATVNGTSALQVALRLVGVKSGDEVLTQALTFVATANSISYNNANPVFLDVDLDTMGMSPRSLKKFLDENAILKPEGCINKSTGNRIAACLPVHTFGYVCRVDEIVEICKEFHIPVVEDASESLGSSRSGKSAGSFGHLGVFSFNGNKIITSGGGGAIVSNNTEIMDKAKHLTTTAKVTHKWEYYHDEVGYNFRMPNLNAALLCAQLERLPHFIQSKVQLKANYDSHFGNLIKSIPEDTFWNHWLISVELSNRAERDEFLMYSNNNGVMTRPIWRPMYELPMYSGCLRDDQKNAKFLEKRIVNIPSSPK